jgi:hypothetical protein
MKNALMQRENMISIVVVLAAITISFVMNFPRSSSLANEAHKANCKKGHIIIDVDSNNNPICSPQSILGISCPEGTTLTAINQDGTPYCSK